MRLLLYCFLFVGCSSTKLFKSTEIVPLESYSYPVFTVTENKVHNGTGFFFQKNNRFFFITNYHLRGMSPIEQKIGFNAEMLYIKVPTNESLYAIIRVPLNTKDIKKFALWEDLDLFGVMIPTIPMNAIIYVVNPLIDVNYFDKIPEKIFVAGYPPYSNSKSDTFDAKLDTFYGNYEDAVSELNENLIKQKAPSNLRTQVVDFHQKNLYFLDTLVSGGFSGSPAFGQFRVKGKNVYKFYGVVFGWSVLKKTWNIKPLASYKFMINLN